MKLPAIIRRAVEQQRATDAPEPGVVLKPNQSREAAYDAALDAAERRYDAEVAQIERRFAA